MEEYVKLWPIFKEKVGSCDISKKSILLYSQNATKSFRWRLRKIYEK